MRCRRRGGKLNDRNKVLLTFLWLRKYRCIDTLALFFDVSRSTVSHIIHSVVPALWRFFSNEVTCRQSLSGIECRVNGIFS